MVDFKDREQVRAWFFLLLFFGGIILLGTAAILDTFVDGPVQPKVLNNKIIEMVTKPPIIVLMYVVGGIVFGFGLILNMVFMCDSDLYIDYSFLNKRKDNESLR